FLQRELAYAVEGRLTPDCSIERCTYCGACDFTKVKNVTYHLHGAKGSEHRGEVIDNWAQVTVDAGDAPGSWEPRGWHKVQAKSAHQHGADADATIAAAGAERTPRAEAAGATSEAAAANSDGRRALPGLGNAEEWL